MATYTVTGHPLNYTSLGLTATETDLLKQLETKGVGQTIDLTLSGGADTKIKSHGAAR